MHCAAAGWLIAARIAISGKIQVTVKRILEWASMGRMSSFALLACQQFSENQTVGNRRETTRGTKGARNDLCVTNSSLLVLFVLSFLYPFKFPAVRGCRRYCPGVFRIYPKRSIRDSMSALYPRGTLHDAPFASALKRGLPG